MVGIGIIIGVVVYRLNTCLLMLAGSVLGWARLPGLQANLGMVSLDNLINQGFMNKKIASVMLVSRCGARKSVM